MKSATPAKKAARKSAPQKPDACPFNAAMKRGDSNAMVTILLAKLDEATDVAQSFSDIIAQQKQIIMRYRGLSALALAQGTR
jgi:hypothetical protein